MFKSPSLVYCVITLSLALSAAAAHAIDTDGDLVEDSIDNCVLDPNGPNEQSNQLDADQDGYGTACDPDFNQDGIVSGRDFTIFNSRISTADPLTDLNGNGVTEGLDFNIFIVSLNGPPGPSGLACADATIDIAAGDLPCTP